MPFGDSTSVQVEEVAAVVVDSIWKVYQELGPGLLESVYEVCLEHELKSRGLVVARQVPVPTLYDGITLDAGFRIDLLVNDLLVIELKAVEKLIPLFDAQLLTYLKLSKKRLGILVNFNTKYLKDQIKRVIL